MLVHTTKSQIAGGRLVALGFTFALLSLTAACGQDQTLEGPPSADEDSAGDSGQVDTGNVGDDTSTGPKDAGATDPDTGSTTPDAGTAAPDTGSAQPDTGTTTPDAGTTTPDTGTSTPDAGTVTPDAGATAPDTGTATPDVGSGDPDTGSVTPDAGGTADTGSSTPDAGTTPDAGQTADSGSTEADSGSTSGDTATGTPDAGGAVDAGPKPMCKVNLDCLKLVKISQCNTAVCLAGQCKIMPLKDGATCSDGDACTGKDTCKAGSCTSGAKLDCDDGNPCTVNGCDKKVGCQAGKAKDGTKCGAKNKCFTGGICKAGKCDGGKHTTCDDSNKCTKDKCDAATGNCVFLASTDKCDDGDGCTIGDACKNGKCQATAKKGCDDKNHCTVDSCDKDTGKCVNKPATAKCDDGNKCTTGDVCKAGKCAPGKPQLCDDGKACTKDSCDPKQGCLATNADGAPCSDDNKCLKGKCAAGTCKLGSGKGCDDNNPCTVDTCAAGGASGSDANGGCKYAAVKDGTKCGDGTKCLDASTCKAGKCAPGAKVDCDDGNPCTKDACDPKLGCSWSAAAGACDDGNKCTAGDACANGSCKAGKKVDPEKACGDGNKCTKASCDAKKGCTNTAFDGACSDANPCTTGETCVKGVCGGGTNDKCDDGKVCTLDVCNAKTGACAWAGKDGKCDDANPCTGDGVCKAGKCGGAAPKDCDDKNICTKDSCDPKSGKCRHTSATGDKPTPCDDNSKCTANTTCQKDGKCAGGKVTVCDDGNTCTKDMCNPTTGKCGFSANNGATCDVGKCTTGDFCKNGACKPGTGKACDDGQTCTNDSCDPKTGTCTFAAGKDGTKCEDGKKCTTGDACKAGQCVPAKDDCTTAKVNVECGKTAGWTFNNSQSNVKWGIDETPKVAAIKDWGCTVNANNGKDYCHSWGNGCRTVNTTMWTPWMSAEKIKGKVRISFDYYMDIDSATDRVTIYLYRENGTTFGQYLGFHQVPKSKLKVPVKDYGFISDKAAGGKIRLRVIFYANTLGNKGAGFFMDNFRLSKLQETPEICTDGKDNDGDGAIDCKDTECKDAKECQEICTDGKDNDADDKVDCDDSDCKGGPACTKPIWSQNFTCGAWPKGWTKANTQYSVKWNVDQTPVVPELKDYGCTLNLNDGTDYCHPWTSTYCRTTNAVFVQSPPIDTTNIPVNAALLMDIYTDLDASDYPYYWIRKTGGGFGTNLHYGTMKPFMCGSTTCALGKKLYKDVTVPLTKVKGQKWTLQLRLYGSSLGNKGKGLFVDNIRVVPVNK